KTGWTMMNANHAMTSATVSSVSPWRNDACAREGRARKVKARNRTKRLPRGWRHLAYERMSESFGFMVYQLPISALYIFNHFFVQKYERTKVIAIGCPRLRCAVLVSDDIVVQRAESSQ